MIVGGVWVAEAERDGWEHWGGSWSVVVVVTMVSTVGTVVGAGGGLVVGRLAGVSVVVGDSLGRCGVAAMVVWTVGLRGGAC